MPAATDAEAVEFYARPDDLAAIQFVPGNRGLVYGHIHDLVAGDAPKVRVLLGRGVEPGRRVAQSEVAPKYKLSCLLSTIIGV